MRISVPIQWHSPWSEMCSYVYPFSPLRGPLLRLKEQGSKVMLQEGGPFFPVCLLIRTYLPDKATLYQGHACIIHGISLCVFFRATGFNYPISFPFCCIILFFIFFASSNFCFRHSFWIATQPCTFRKKIGQSS